jgi:hypothetical protein
MTSLIVLGVWVGLLTVLVTVLPGTLPLGLSWTDAVLPGPRRTNASRGTPFPGERRYPL